MLDFVAGLVAPQGDGEQGQGGGESGHEYGSEAFFGASEGELGAYGQIFLGL